MSTELGLLSSTPLQKLSHQSQQNQPSPVAAAAWMLNPEHAPQEDDDDSWEVKAFAEDTGNIMGTTWPPRSYTCTFCRREFRSAQALGGHMNVHRRERAKLHQTQPPAAGSSSSTSSSTLIIPTQELITNSGGFCLLSQLPNPSGLFTPTTVTACAIDTPSTLLSISPYPLNKLSPNTNIPSASTSNTNESAIEELDLELRLGHRPTPS